MLTGSLNTNMETVYHPQHTRSHRDMGWIQLYQSFNPNNPPTPDRRHFGAMIILDNGIIAPGGKGFGMHPHDNMEIVSVVISGAMVHSDTAGNEGVNLENAVQLISAGTGIHHSEYNLSDDISIDNLQIWFLPRERNVPPKYQTMISDPLSRENKLQLLVSPKGEEESLHIGQNVWMWRGTFQENESLTYAKKQKRNGVYLFIIEGDMVIKNQRLQRRDGFGLVDSDSVEIKFNNLTDILIIDVPLEI